MTCETTNLSAYKCYNCNDENDRMEFCSHSIPTPWCRACRTCLCSEKDERESEKKIRFYHSICDDYDLLNSISSRYALEQRLVKERLQYGTATPQDVKELRRIFTAPQVNELIRILIHEDITRYARRPAPEGTLPRWEAFSAMDRSIFRKENVFPIRLLNHGFSPEVVVVYGMLAALKSLKKMGLSPERLYIGIASAEPPKFLAPHFAEERDFTGELQAFEDWMLGVLPDRVYFYRDGEAPQCRIGNNKRVRYLSEAGQFPFIERIKEYFSASSKFRCEFHDSPEGESVLVPHPLRITSDFANTCDTFWKELLVSIGRSSGIILLQSDLKEIAFVRQYLLGTLLEEGHEVSDFQNYKPGQSFYEGDIVMAHHLQLEGNLLPLLELARSVPVILFYTSAVHPSEYIGSPRHRKLFNDYVIGHYLFTAVRYLCTCARGVTPQPVVLDSKVTLDLYEPKGCERCFQTGYRQKSLVLIPYTELFPSTNHAGSAIDAIIFRTIFPSKTLDYYYATRLLGPEIKNQELLTRMNEV
jgi:hypothetical protein